MIVMVEEKKHAGNGAEPVPTDESSADQAHAEDNEVEAEVQGPEEADEGREKVSEEVTDLLQENERLKMEVRESVDKALRATAELENVRRRTSRDIENAHKYALERFVNELLPVIDSMELGINASQSAEDIESLREGMDLTLKKLFDSLEKFGVKAIDPAGEKFDPDWHEAVSMQELEGSASGQVVTVMQKGYELNGRLVRPAMVVVAK